MDSHSSDAKTTIQPDALSAILGGLRPTGVEYSHCQLSRPWGVELPKQSLARLYLVVSGEAWLRSMDVGAAILKAGDVAFLPTGERHTLADSPDRRTRPLSSFRSEPISELTYRLELGAVGSTLVASCTIRFEDPTTQLLLQMMPSALVVHRATTEDTVLPGLLDAMADEVMKQRMGAAIVLTRLAEVIIVRLVRTWIEKRPGDIEGWLAAVHDPRIGKALIAIHQHPGDKWSVGRLASIAGLSRSMFTDRFTKVLKVSPGHYLTQWRMNVARGWLHRERLTVSEVASRLGYESEPAFSRAFKRIVGIPPSRVLPSNENP